MIRCFVMCLHLSWNCYEVPEKDRTYIMAFYIRGLMAIITEWLKTDCKDSIEYIITVIQKCVMRHQEEK